MIEELIKNNTNLNCKLRCSAPQISYISYVSTNILVLRTLFTNFKAAELRNICRKLISNDMKVQRMEIIGYNRHFNLLKNGGKNATLNNINNLLHTKTKLITLLVPVFICHSRAKPPFVLTDGFVR